MDFSGAPKKFQSGLTLVTGGAGFIGSNLVDRLISNDYNVRVVDNLSNGKLVNLKNSEKSKNFHFEKSELNNPQSLNEILDGVKIVFHLAADPEVRTGFEDPTIAYRENIQNTFHILEAIRKNDVETIIFTSSATVYGEPDKIPTPENYGPLYPISSYGSSKLACEAMISSYCHTYGINGLIFRLVNIVGPRSKHGVIFDFINKLKKNSSKLEILGDGSQAKSYLHVTDCIDSMLFCISEVKKRTEVFNIGNDDKTDVITIGRTVCEAMGLVDVELQTTGGVEGRGWIGDVKLMHLDISKLKNMGWSPKLSSTKAVEIATKELLCKEL